jgi:hypothetical protein
VAKACIDVCPKNSNNFSVDNVRVCKVRRAALSSAACLVLTPPRADHRRRAVVQQRGAGSGGEA